MPFVFLPLLILSPLVLPLYFCLYMRYYLNTVCAEEVGKGSGLCNGYVQRRSVYLVMTLLYAICRLHIPGADKSLARPTSRSILFDGENISFDASLVLCIYIYIYIVLIFLQL